MKTGMILKNADNTISSDDLSLINAYTRRELSADEVYVFSVVLCDNDIDRDYERFTVESLFELEKLFVGKTGIFDHNASAKNQTARIFECKVEALDGKKTMTGDDYFRLVCRAYMPKSEKNKDLILSLDSGIIKEVSVGCAVKNTICSICSNDIHSTSCHHTKGSEYNGQLCFGELTSVYDAYEFSFVAVPAQKNAGVIKAFSENKREKIHMKEILKALKKGEELLLENAQSKALFDYISELEKQADDGKEYKKQLTESVCKTMSITHSALDSQTVKDIVSQLTVSQLRAIEDAHKKQQTSCEVISPQLYCEKQADTNAKSDTKNQFTI